METIVARAYQINDLTRDRVEKLHAWEKRNRSMLQPWEINKYGHLRSHGEQPEFSISRVSSVVLGIYTQHVNNVQDEIMAEPGPGADMIYVDMEPVHRTDLEIKRRSIEFYEKDPNKKNQVLHRITKAMESDDDFNF